MSKKVGSLICKNNHTFDISREGYVNMLLARKKLPKTVGDNRDMILARSKFLSLGYYGPLVQTINGM
ncbi:MAG: 23S rRNA (guanine(745)-N(1))-methyltransferase, partial [Candidatus Zambryskibacteria bacterium CG22_combo_CG10-13_8_21_14_all_42_17]